MKYLTALIKPLSGKICFIEAAGSQVGIPLDTLVFCLDFVCNVKAMTRSTTPFNEFLVTLSHYLQNPLT